MTAMPLPDEFKGIAVFTPGGDVIYTIDPHKQSRWHTHLCIALQERFGLPEPPYFLTPAYTATLDRWRDPRTQKLQVYAELHPPIRHYRAFLNAIFDTPGQSWDVIPWHRSSSDPLIIDQYRDSFAPLWESQGWILNYQEWEARASQVEPSITDHTTARPAPQLTYALRLFVSGNNRTTEHHLQTLHTLLENNLTVPYTLTIIDILKSPELAEADHITATPTLVKTSPPPVRRIVGSLDDPQQLLKILLQ